MTPATKPRVLFVNRSYWPDAEATGQLLTELCESLADRFEVSVLCGQPNSNPGGEPFVAKGIQVRHGVTIHRLRHSQFNKSKPAGRIANLVTFTAAARRWLRGHSRFDIVVAETDPFLLPLVVGPHCARAGCHYVAYLQDIYPDIAIRLEMAKDNWFTRQLRNRLCRAYHSSKRMIVLGEAMKCELCQWGLPADKIVVVPNWIDCQSIVPSKVNNPFRDTRKWTGEHYVVMHSGNMGLSQKLDTLVAAVDCAAFPVNAKLALVGGGADQVRLQRLAANAKRSHDIELLPYQPRQRLGDSLSAADVHVISVDPRIGGTLMPSKLYGILASATPVLVIAPPASEVAQIVQHEQVGLVVPDHSPKLIAAGVAQLAKLDVAEQNAMQRRARELAESKYDRSICVARFACTLEQILERPVAPVPQVC